MMKFKLCIFALGLSILLFACNTNTGLVDPSLTDNDEPLVVLDEVLNSISNVWNALPVPLLLTNDTTIPILKSSDFMFLRLQSKDCDVCFVNTISDLNEFQTASETGQKLYLIIDEMGSKEKANFLSGFKLNNVEVIFINSQLSKLDEIGGGAYFGHVSNGVITDALPVHQLFVKEFIFSFLKKGSIK